MTLLGSTRQKRYRQLKKYGYSPKYIQLKWKDLTTGMRKRIKKKDWYATNKLKGVV